MTFVDASFRCNSKISIFSDIFITIDVQSDKTDVLSRTNFIYFLCNSRGNALCNTNLRCTMCIHDSGSSLKEIMRHSPLKTTSWTMGYRNKRAVGDVLTRFVLRLQKVFAIKVFKLQLFQIDVLKHTNLSIAVQTLLYLKIGVAYVHSHKIDSVWHNSIEVDHNTTAARWTKFVPHPHFSKCIGFEMIIAGTEDDFLSFSVNVKVAIDAAYRASATDNLLIRQRGYIHGVSHGAAVAVCFVMSQVWNCCDC